MRTKVKIAWLMLFAMILTTGSAVITRADSKNDENVFIVGFDAEFPPYGYKDDNGEYVGFDLDLAQEVCNRRGWTLVKQPIDWDSKDMELKSESIDCIWNGFTMNGREDGYTWSVPYIDNSQVVIVNKESGITELTDLKGKTVVVQSDSSALAAFTGEDATDENKTLCESFAQLQQVSDYNSAFMNLESQMVDAICLDIGVAKYQVESRGDKFIMLEEQVSSEAYGIGFKLGNTELRDLVEKTLAEMEADGTFEEIAKQWDLSDCICLKESLEARNETKEIIDGSDQKIKHKIDMGLIIKQLSKGMIATLSIFLMTLLFSMPLGLLISFARMSKLVPVQWLAKIYISIMRGTPLMLQLLVVYFGPSFLFGVSGSSNYRFIAVIIGFSLNYAAYFAEIYRSGIQSIPNGQREAALVLGYSRTQTFCKIIFPQMIKRVLPSITNEIITLVKDTSLAFALSYAEMFTLAKQVAAAQTTVIPLFVAGVFYYVFNFAVAMIMERVEKRLNYYQ